MNIDSYSTVYLTGGRLSSSWIYLTNGCYTTAEDTQILLIVCNYPTCACAARGYVIGRGVYILFISLHFFWNQTFIFQNTHFQRSILTQIGFLSNLVASGTA